MGSSPVAITQTSDFVPVSSKEFFDIQATIECGFTLKCVHHMTRTYRLMLGVEGRKLLLKKNYPKSSDSKNLSQTIALQKVIPYH